MRTAGLIAGFFVLAVSSSGCLRPSSRGQLVTEAAREMNLAARFGRLDIAAGHAAKGARKHFLSRRSQWGREIRVVDVELSSLNITKDDRALVHVDVAWVRMNEGELKSTRVAQVWRDQRGGWLLVREKRVAGAIGLFGEPVRPKRKKQSGDVHFPSKTIR